MVDVAVQERCHCLGMVRECPRIETKPLHNTPIKMKYTLIIDIRSAIVHKASQKKYKYSCRVINNRHHAYGGQFLYLADILKLNDTEICYYDTNIY